MYEIVARRLPPPKNIAVDSSGFSHSTGSEWVAVRFKKTRRRRFHALHNAVDTDTLMINASYVRPRPGGDAKHMIALVRRMPRSELELVLGDKAYISRRNVQFIADVGAYPAIEPKSNSSVRSKGRQTYGELIREYRSDPKKWKEVHQYGKVSLVETVFSMMKLRFGGALSSKGQRERRVVDQGSPSQHKPIQLSGVCWEVIYFTGPTESQALNTDLSNQCIS